MRLTLHKTIGFNEDQFFVRVRRGTPQVLLNRGSEGVCLVDCVSGAIAADIRYPSGVDDFSPYAVLISPDGSTAHLFGSDLEPFAIEVDLVGLRARRLKLVPPGGIFMSVGWFQPDLNILDANAHTWALNGNQIVKQTSQKKLSEHGEFLRQLCRRYALRKMDSTATGVYVFGGNEKGEITVGHIPFEGPSLFSQQRGDAIDVAGYDDKLFICYERELTWDQNLVRALPSERFLAIDTLIAGGPILSVLVDAKVGPGNPDGELKLFRIEP